jgi:NADPH-dependent curcumin reductase CurA
LLVVFNTNSGKTITQKTSAYVIKSEWENFEAGKLVSVIYVERSRQLFIQQVLMRKLENEKRQYFLSGIWLLVGVALYIFIPNSKKPKPKTMYLYL